MNRAKSILVTYVNFEGPLMKIWGQIDKTSAASVEELLIHYTPQFNSGFGNIHPNSLSVGQLVISKFVDDNYYRARILNLDNLSQGKVFVHFTDYGNNAYVTYLDIRVTDEECLSTLASVADQATEFILKGVLPIGGVWSSNTIEFIRNILTYTDVKIFVESNFQNNLMIQLFLDENKDFASILVNENICEPISTISQYHLIHAFSKNPYNLDTQYENIFKLPDLKRNTNNSVHVSFIENGPFCFVVHLTSQREELFNLTQQLQQVKLINFSKTPTAGTPILTRFNEDGIIYRAIIMSVNNVANSCEVYYIDFGNSEIVGLNEIFEIPPPFLLINVMGIRFSLAEISNEPIMLSERAKEAFKDLVLEQQFDLVIAHEEHSKSMRQYCRLFQKGIDVKTLLLNKLNPLPNYKPFSLNENTLTLDVRILFIDSIKNFFVQPVDSIEVFEIFMEEIQKYCKFAESLDLKDIYPSCPVLAFYEPDLKWYRAEIVNSDQHLLTVQFVDYGNVEAVKLKDLKKNTRYIIETLPKQAIRCCLEILDTLLDTNEVDKKFEILNVTPRNFSMNILNRNESPMKVELFNDDINIGHFLINSPTELIKKLPQIKKNTKVNIEEKFSHKDLERSNSVENQKYICPQLRSQENSDHLNYNWRQKNSQTSDKNLFKESKINDEIPNEEQLNNDITINETQNKFIYAEKYSNIQPIPGDILLTKVVFIENCDNFFLQLTSNELEVENLQYKIEEYISNSIQNKDNDKNLFTPGNPCLAKYNQDDQWYRGQIIKSLDGGKHVVYFVDYGNMEDIYENELLPLPLELSHLPTQAINVKLAGSKPINGKSFNVEDVHKLQDEVENYQLKTLFLFWESNSIQGIYEVLIYEGDNEDCINLKFGANLQEIESLERPQYLETILDQNLQLDINISLFISPNRMYCQEVLALHYLEKIKTKLNEHFLFDKDSFRCSFYYHQPVIARYKQDNQLYRGEILKIIDDEALVLFVDYGNSEKMNLIEIWPLYDKELFSIPKIAFRCSLYNIRPPENMSKWPTNLSITDYFKEKTYKCFVKNDATSVFKVELFDSQGNNISDLLVAKQMASYEISNLTAEKNEKRKTSHCENNFNNFTFRNLFPDFETISLNLLVGQIIPIRISHIKSSDNFYIQLLPNVVDYILDSISKIKYLKRINKNELNEGFLYLASFDNKYWFRAQFLNYSQKILQFFDTGKIVSLERLQLAEMPQDLINYPRLAYSATLYQNLCENSDIINNLKPLQDYLCLIKAFNEDRLEICLYSRDGKIVDWMPKQMNLNLENEIIQLPIIIQNALVEVTHTLNENNVYIQYVFHKSLINTINCKLDDLFLSSKLERIDQASSKSNLACVKLDQFWYRARIMDRDGNIYKIQLIDFGNIKNVDTNNLFILPKTLFYHELCTLIEVENPLQNLNLGSNFIANFIKKNEHKWNVVMKFDKIDQKTPITPLLKIGEQYSGVASYVESPKHFYIQLSEYANDIEVLQEKINSQISNMESWQSNKDNKLVAAYFEGFWYRAIVLVEQSQVYFVDYGNTCEIDYNNIKKLPEDLGMIPPYAICCTLEDYSSNEEIQITDNVIEKFENIIFSFEEILCKIIKHEDKKYIVQLSIDNEKIDKKFIEESNDEINQGQNEEFINQKDENLIEQFINIPMNEEIHGLNEINDQSKVIISFVDSNLKVWIQLAENLDKITKISELISENINFVKEPYVGLICGAIYEENWYRCIINSVDENLNSVDIFFIDYGNKALVNFDELTELPLEMTYLPGYSYSLNLKIAENNYSNNIESILMEHYLENVDQEYLYCKKTNSLLLLNGDNLLDSLNQRSYELKTVINENANFDNNIEDEGNPKIHEDIHSTLTKEDVDHEQNEEFINQEKETEQFNNIPMNEEIHGLNEINDQSKVIISFVDSNLKVWIQLAENLDKITKISEFISENINILKEPYVGLICGAIYEENWYRCIINSVDENLNSVDIFFIDYGNKALVNFDELSELPLEMTHLPPYSFSLNLKIAENNYSNNSESILIEHYLENVDQEYLYCKKTNSLLLLNGDNFLDSLNQRSHELKTVNENANFDTTIEDDANLKIHEDIHNTLSNEDVDHKQNEEFINQEKENLIEVLNNIPMNEKIHGLNEINDQSKVIISFVDSSLKVWIQLAENLDKITKISEFISENINYVKEPYVGLICGALYDEKWYRCIINSVDENLNSVDIFFIDYGNKALVNFDELSELPLEMTHLPPYSFSLNLKIAENNYSNNIESILIEHYLENVDQEYLYCKKTNSLLLLNGDNLLDSLNLRSNEFVENFCKEFDNQIFTEQKDSTGFDEKSIIQNIDQKLDCEYQLNGNFQMSNDFKSENISVINEIPKQTSSLNNSLNKIVDCLNDEDKEIVHIMERKHIRDNTEKIVPGALTYFSLNVSPIESEISEKRPSSVPMPIPSPRRFILNNSSEQLCTETVPKPAPRNFRQSILP